jgi:hypothetical protein
MTMTGTIIPIAAGFLLLALLVLLVRRSQPQTSGSFDSTRSLAVPQFEEGRQEILERIFGPGDWDFIRSHASKEVQRLFLRERKQLACWWLSEIRNRTRAAMHFHFITARRSEKLQPMLELRLATSYLMVQAMCWFIVVVLLLWGPTAIRPMLEQASGLSDRARALVEVAFKTNPLAETVRAR